MKLSKSLLSSHLCASKDLTRPALNFVKVETLGNQLGRISSTDGHIAVTMEFPTSIDTPLTLPEGTESPTVPVLLPVQSIKDILKGAKTDEEIDLVTNEETGYLLRGSSFVTFPLEEDVFPDLEAVWPTENN